MIKKILQFTFRQNNTIQKPERYIILKMDDFAGIKSSKAQKRLNRFVYKEKIKVNWGIIGEWLTNFRKRKINDALKALKSGHYAFFNHGYTHVMNEFRLLSLEEQIEHLKMTQKITKERLGIKLVTFAAPCNALNENTLTAVESIPDFQFWLFGDVNFSKTNFVCELKIEDPFPTPNFEKFVMNFKNNSSSILVLECHPNAWNSDNFDEFKKIIHFLKQNNCEFIFPTDLTKEVLK